MLARHVRTLFKDQLGLNFRFEKAPKTIVRDLTSLESLGSYHRWLRGVLCYLTLAVFAMSLASLEGSRKNVVDWAIFGASLPAEIIIFRVYQVKYRLAGLTDIIYKKDANLVNSPYFYQMLGEVLLWLMQCPPYVAQRFPMLELLNFMPFLRLYTVAIYLNNSSFAYRPFCRAMAAVCGTPLTLSLFMRSALLYKSLKASFILSGSLWVTLALMYGKAEGIDFSNSMWFVFVTVGTIGYGDIAPITTQGRIIAFISWVYSLTLIGYVVVLTHGVLKLKDSERNMFILFRSNKLMTKIQHESATTIQRCWRFYAAKKANSFVLTKSHLAYLLLTQLAKMRKVQKTLREACKTFRGQMDQASAAPDHANSLIGPQRQRRRRETGVEGGGEDGDLASPRSPRALDSPARSPRASTIYNSSSAFGRGVKGARRSAAGTDAPGGAREMESMASPLAAAPPAAAAAAAPPAAPRSVSGGRQQLDSIDVRLLRMELAAAAILAKLQVTVAARQQQQPQPLEAGGASAGASAPPVENLSVTQTPQQEDTQRDLDDEPLMGGATTGDDATPRVLYGDF